MSNVKSGVPIKPFRSLMNFIVIDNSHAFQKQCRNTTNWYVIIIFYVLESILKRLNYMSLFGLNLDRQTEILFVASNFVVFPSNNNHLEKGIHRGLLDWHSHYVIFRDQQLSMGPFLLRKKIVRYQENCLIQLLWQCCTSGTSIKFKWCFET